jgi:2-iminoacetate synthase ThiH
MFSRALEQAGLSDLQARVLSGDALNQAELARLASADLLLVAGLADSMREHFRGDDVRVIKPNALRETELVLFERSVTEHGETGAELLRELALLRLATRPTTGIAVSMETLGLELAQTALLFGADTLLGDLNGSRTLPLLEGASARQREVEGLVLRSGRKASFAQAQEPAAEQRS